MDSDREQQYKDALIEMVEFTNALADSLISMEAEMKSIKKYYLSMQGPLQDRLNPLINDSWRESDADEG